eukprot:scaffold3096_cov403-Prasinococcus_capsulatus_cf.AAC.7
MIVSDSISEASQTPPADGNKGPRRALECPPPSSPRLTRAARGATTTATLGPRAQPSGRRMRAGTGAPRAHPPIHSFIHSFMPSLASPPLAWALDPPSLSPRSAWLPSARRGGRGGLGGEESGPQRAVPPSAPAAAATFLGFGGRGLRESETEIRPPTIGPWRPAGWWDGRNSKKRGQAGRRAPRPGGRIRGGLWMRCAGAPNPFRATLGTLERLTAAA